jgi:hypothetical protein
MRRLLLAALILVSSAATAQYAVSLKFPDKSVELCTSPGFVVDYLTVDITVTQCSQDTIFIGNMGG